MNLIFTKINSFITIITSSPLARIMKAFVLFSVLVFAFNTQSFAQFCGVQIAHNSGAVTSKNDILCPGDFGSIELFFYTDTSLSKYPYKWEIRNSNGDSLRGGTAATRFAMVDPAGPVTGLVAGTYYLYTCNNFNQQLNTISITINEPATPFSASLDPITAVCSGEAAASVTARGSGGNPNYDFVWDPGAFQTNNDVLVATANNLIGGNAYSVTVTDENGCDTTIAFTIPENLPPTDIDTSVTHEICNNNGGEINVTGVTGGTAGYNYNINGGAYGAGATFSGLNEGTHTVCVRDVNSCTYCEDIVIVDLRPTDFDSTVTHETCTNANGVIEVGAITGGVPLYQINIDAGAFGASTTLSGLSNGAHTVCVRDANLCVYCEVITINNSPSPTDLDSAVTHQTCSQMNGEIIITGVTGGTPVYSYNINGGAFGASNTFSGLNNGTYQICARDANNCTFCEDIVVVEIPVTTDFDTTVTHETCNLDNGEIIVGAITGGSGPFTYNINGGGFGAMATFSGLSAATYTVCVRDVNDCDYCEVIVVNNLEPTDMDSTVTHPTCAGGNGIITITGVTGGVGPYEYNIDGGAYGPAASFAAQASGAHTVCVRDANLCVYCEVITLVDNPGPTDLDSSVVHETCTGANGSITVTGVTGGTGPYQYNIDGGAYSFLNVFSNLGNGTYQVCVQDANGCTHCEDIDITDTPGPTDFDSTVTHETCTFGNGEIIIGAITGGTGPFQYNIDGGAYDAVATFSNLAAATYTMCIQDATGCEYCEDIDIINFPAATDFDSTVTHETCTNANGEIIVGAITGGTGPFLYNIDGGAFGAMATFSGLAEATYTVCVQDANLCEYCEDIDIINFPTATDFDSTVTHETCTGANGEIVIGAITGGTGPFLYNIDGGGFGASNTFSNLAAGTYTICVQDANLCEYCEDIDIIDFPEPTDFDSTVTHETCTGANGEIVIGAITGGTGPFQYNIDGGAYGASATFSNLAAATYTICIQDANGCIYCEDIDIVDFPGPTDFDSTVTHETCTNANGEIVVGAITGGTGPYLYNIDGGVYGASATFSNLSAATYTVCIQDANLCEYCEDIDIINFPAATDFDSTVTHETCTGANGEIIVGAITGGTGPFLYNIDGGAFGAMATFSGLSAATHTVCVQDANLCEYCEDIIINDISPTDIDSAVTHEICGGIDGEITVTGVTGGTAPYEYNIDGGAYGPGATFSGLAAATYNICTRDANLCVYCENIVIIDTRPTDLDSAITHETCSAGNGEITVTGVSGGTASYNYNINGGVYGASNIFSNLPAGTYSIGVEDANGCTYFEDIDVIDFPSPTAIDSTLTHASCGNSDGEVVINSVTGGTAPFEYSFDGALPFVATTTYSGLAFGNYTIDVRDANGCIYSTSVDILNLGAPTDLDSTVTHETCNLNNGQIVVTAVTGGTAPYLYNINAGPFGAGNTFAGLGNASYTIGIQDANGCLYNEIIAINDINPTDIDSAVTHETCTLVNGEITVSGVTGGLAPYQYNINAGAYGAAATFSGLAAGTYTVCVRDANLCVYCEDIVITNFPGPTDLDSTVVHETCTGANGQITITGVTSGTAAYTYNIDGGVYGATTVFSGLSAGPHIIGVRDANACAYSEIVTITNSPGPTDLDTTVIHETCTGANGQITITGVTGGTAAHTYNIDGGAYGAATVFSGLSAGPHTIGVRDANTCVYSEVVTLTNSASPTDLDTAVIHETCTGANGQITITGVTGGTAAYTYNIDGGAFGAMNTFSGLDAATYTICVQDANLCQYCEDITINNSDITDFDSTVTHETCTGANGEITVTGVTGGLGPYQYNINGGAYAAANTFSGLSAGTYTVCARDASGCIYCEDIVVNDITPTDIDSTVTHETCTDANGQITVTGVTGGTGPYTYNIDGGVYGAATVFPNLSNGTHQVCVEDANFCNYCEDIVITDSPAPTDVDVTITNATCGLSDGQLDVDAVTGGTPAYTYTFDGSVFTATTSYSGYAAGIYNLNILDANDCPYDTTVTILNDGGPTDLDTSLVHEVCAGVDGEITITGVIDGTAPFIYNLDGGLFGPGLIFSGLPAATYTLGVEDANGCQYFEAIIINNIAPTDIDTTITHETCSNVNGEINVSGITGGLAPYQYNINGGAYGASTTFSGLLAGTYTICVQDANGCVYCEDIIIINFPSPTDLDSAVTHETCTNANGEITITGVTGGTGPYTYNIDGGAYGASNVLSNLSNGTHQVCIEDANFCGYCEDIVIVDSPAPTAVDLTITNATCGNSDGQVDIISVTDGTAPFQYDFNNGGYSIVTSYTNLAVNIYPLSIQDANGCIFDTTANVINIGAPTDIDTALVHETCTDTNGVITITGVTAGLAPYNYNINGSVFAAATVFTPLPAGTYRLGVEDANGCIYYEDVVLNDINPTDFDTTITHETCTGSNGEIIVGAITGGLGPYQYNINGGAYGAANTFSGLSAGTYTVCIEDANGCEYCEDIIITNAPSPTISSVVTDVLCNGDNNGAINVTISGGTNPIGISWTDGPVTEDRTNLVAGTYTITLTDANGCITSAAMDVVEPAVLAITASANDASCKSICDGDVIADNATGGTGPYSYAWNGGLGAGQSFTGTVCAGSYTVTVTDANACTANTIVIVDEPDTLLVTTSSNDVLSCAGNCEGDVIADNATGGTIPYTYSWSGGLGAGQSFIGTVCAGTYTVTATDNNGCTATATVVVDEPPVLSVTASGTDLLCNGDASGTVTAIGSGGTGLLTYNWIPGNLAGAARVNLAAGTYTVVVTDANGCTASDDVTISEPAVLSLTYDSTNTNCNGVCDGSANVIPAGGTPLYSYLWSTDGSSNDSINGLCAGNHSVTVTDANGCNAIKTFNISEPFSITASFVNTLSQCLVCDGTSTVTAGGGTGTTYTYLWNDPLAQTTALATDLCAGIYDLIITDSLNCSVTFTTTINNFNGPVLAHTIINEPTCYNDTDAAAEVTAAGNAPFTFAWAPGGYSNDTVLTLSDGTYNVIVTDANGCITIEPVVITEPDTILANPTVTHISCFGECDGAIVLAPTGGSNIYTDYSWSGGLPNSASVSNLCTNTYLVTITDDNGCQGTASIDVNTPLTLSVLAEQINVDCNDANTGQAWVDITGGTAPYTVIWSTGDTVVTNFTSLISSLFAGTYTAAIADANGCVDTVTFNIIENGPIVIGFTVSDVSCNSGNDGSITSSVSGGVGPYSLFWSNAENTSTINNLTAGEYILTATDNLGCEAEDTATVTQPAVLTATITSYSDVSCNGGNDGEATVEATGGTAPYIYLWSDNQDSTTAVNLVAGAYTVTVTDANACIASDNVVIAEPDALTHNPVITDATCNSADGEALLNPLGGTGPYTFEWSDAQVVNPAVNLLAGLYWVAITDANSCVDTFNVTVNNINGPVLLMSVTDAFCNDSCDGSANVTVISGDAPYTYSWNTIPAQTDTFATGICAGEIIITVTDVNGCITNATDTVGEPAQILANEAILSACSGSCNGAITVNPSGGTPPYTFAWSTGASASGLSTSITNLCATNYSLTITDANGCVFNQTFNVPENSPILVSVAKTNITCNGSCNGTIALSVIGGSGSYLYNWVELGMTSSSVDSLCPGFYTVIVTDSVYSACSTSLLISISQPAELAVTASATDVSCFGICDGTISSNVSGGTSPYSVSWMPGNLNGSAHADLCASGYTVTVTDNKGCIDSASVTINEPSEILANEASSGMSCNGICDGSATVAPTGGTGVYTYLWSIPGETGPGLINLCEGNYSVDITDDSGCEVSHSFTISEPDAITATITGVLPDCGVCNGSLTAGNVAGGNGAPYSYLWYNAGNQTTPVASNLCAGLYNVRITDNSGCSDTLTSPLNNIIGPNTASFIINNVTCNAGNDGAAYVTANGANPPFAYLWTPGNLTNDTANSLSADTYFIQVTDNNNCINFETLTITEPDEIEGNPVITPVSCSGNCDGLITLNATGGSGSFTDYTWVGLPSGDTQNNLCIGSYTVTITDNLGCTNSETIDVDTPNPLSISQAVTDVNCKGYNTGSIILSASGGTSPYSVIWSTGDSVSVISSSSVSSLYAGTYWAKITDANGCNDSVSIVVSEPDTLSSGVVVTNVTCAGAANGTIAVTPSGGTAPYSNLWLPSGLTSGSIANLSPGLYGITITDANGCEITEIYTITQPDTLTASISLTTPITCANSCDAVAVVSPQGGTAPYYFLWNPGGGTNDTLANLCEGNFNVEVRDSNNCVADANIVINAPSPIEANVTVTEPLCGDSSGLACAAPSGGMGAPYRYLWSNGDTISCADSLMAGLYTLEITDNSGCMAEFTIPVSNIDGPALTSGSVNATCNGSCNGSAYVSALSGPAPFDYSWNPISNYNDSAENLCAGTYFASVTDSNGCVTIETIVINEPAPIVIDDLITNATCGECDGEIAIAGVSGGTGTNYGYSWSNGETTPVISGLCAGIYTLMVTDDIGCSVTENIPVNNEDGPSGVTQVVNNPSCFGSCDGNACITPIGGTAPYTYWWIPSANGQGTNCVTSLCANTYAVQITDSNSCMYNAIVIVDEPLEIDPDESITDPACGISDGSIVLNPSGGNGGPYTYDWSDGLPPVPVQSNLAAGVYLVDISDGSCMQSFTFILSNIDGPSVSVTTTDVDCFGGSNGTATANISGGSGDYTISWSAGTPSGNICTDLSAGNHTVTVIDNVTGCQTSRSFTINEPDELLLGLINTTDASCDEVCDGRALVFPIGGALPYDYLWSSLETGSSAIKLCVGNNAVSVTDANGCSVGQSFSITPLNNLNASITTNDADCGVCNGSAVISPSGGAGPYFYQWSNLSSASSEDSLCASIYPVKIRDSKGCSIDINVLINNNGGPDSADVSVTDATCFSSGNGGAAITPYGGTVPYSYLWIESGETGNMHDSLYTGNYTVQVTDSNNCVLMVPVSVGSPSEITSSVFGLNATCGQSNGSITILSIAGGVGPYSSVLIPGNQSGIYFDSLNPGTYTIRITDNMGCTQDSVLPLNNVNGPILSADISKITCNGSCDGGINLTVTGGSGSYSYLWLDGTPDTLNAITNSISNLCAGQYYAEVIDISSSCMSIVSSSLQQPDALNFGTPTLTHVLCGGACTGTATVVPFGGTLPYQLTWPGAGISGPGISDLCVGSHTVDLIDANGCTLSQTVTINELPAVVADTLYVIHPACASSTDGEAAVTGIGGTLPYSFSWNPGNQTSDTALGLTSGVTVVTVTDANGCFDTLSVNLIPQIVVVADAGSDINECIESGQITLMASGGNNYTWYYLNDSDTIGNSDTVSVNPVVGTNTYVVQVFIGPQCFDYDTVDVNIDPLPLIDAGSDVSVLEDTEVVLGGSPTGPEGAVYSWSNPDLLNSSSDPNPLTTPGETTVFAVTVIDTNGCVNSDTIKVIILPKIKFPTGFTPNADGINDVWVIDNIEEFPGCVVEVYNRWGEMLFMSPGYTQQWDGKYNSKDLPVGTYYYVIDLRDSRFPPYTGPITIMR